MRTRLPLLLALLAAAPASALEAGSGGAGVILGVPFGVTGKYWVDDRKAVQGALGVSDGDLALSSDLLIHFEDVLPKKKVGSLPLYAGLGIKYKAERRDFVGIRFVGGAALYDRAKRHEFFFEVAPVLRFSPSEGAAFDGAVGVRRYFSL
ncbi:MAG: hypothetical protein SF051_16030 [Elusimicrobiota bacterium]|nr:hypothetical protein [Elusimicrobiota bacterium]